MFITWDIALISLGLAALIGLTVVARVLMNAHGQIRRVALEDDDFVLGDLYLHHRLSGEQIDAICATSVDRFAYENWGLEIVVGNKTLFIDEEVAGFDGLLMQLGEQFGFDAAEVASDANWALLNAPFKGFQTVLWVRV